ncbi:MAG TPA: DUF3365 domain-containing protein [Clostridia bacterium]|nr:DUF3365 domain-containing protein [Clostridia bacterium]
MKNARFIDKLGVRLVLCLAIITIWVSILSFVWTFERQKARAEAELMDKARVAASQFLATRAFVAESYQYYYPVTDPENLAQFEHLDPAAAEKGVRELFRGDEAWFFKEIWLPSSDDLHAPDEFELELLNRLRVDPSSQEAWGIDTIDGRRYFRYLLPIHIEEPCLTCHSNDSHIAFSQEVPRYELGELAGAVSLGIPMVVLEETLRTETIAQVAVTGSLIVLSALAIYWFVRQLVERPLTKLAWAATAIGEGHLDYPLPKIAVPVEIRQLAKQLDSMATRLKRYYDDLEHQVAERTAELRYANEILKQQREELQKANRRLAEANKLKSEFLASVSHELRTPLTSITAFVELLLEGVGGELTDLQKEYLNDVLRGSQRLLTSINAILDMAKIEAKKMGLLPSWFSVADVINDVAHRMEPIAVKKEVRLLVDEDLPQTDVYADKEKIDQVLVNLISNAIKFTDAGGLVRVKACYDEQAQEVTVCVSDTGIGIAPEQQEYIFEAFRQVDGSTTRKHPGTGLGLAIAKSFVEMHGGKIWVESDLGMGSNFYFTIPKILKEVEVTENGGQ